MSKLLAALVAGLFALSLNTFAADAPPPPKGAEGAEGAKGAEGKAPPPPAAK